MYIPQFCYKITMLFGINKNFYKNGSVSGSYKRCFSTGKYILFNKRTGEFEKKHLCFKDAL